MPAPEKVEAGREKVLDLPQEGDHLVHLGSSPAAWGKGERGGVKNIVKAWEHALPG